MQSSDTVESPVVGQSGYPLKIQELVETLNKLVSELIAAQGNDANLADALAGYIKGSGLTQNLNADGHEIVGLANASSPASAVTLQQLTALVAAGTTDPGTIAITSLGVGLLDNGQVLGAVDGSLMGVDISNLVTAAALTQEVQLLNQKNTELQEKINEAEGLAIIGM